MTTSRSPRHPRRGESFILDEDAERADGRDAQWTNISAATGLRDALRTTLGPRGMDKMLIEPSGPDDKPHISPEDTTPSTRGSGFKMEEVVVTNDGATILEMMDIDHPAAQMIAETARIQDEEVGDGTTTVTVLAGELLSQAETLLDDDVHPTTIVDGYHEAARLAREAIDTHVIDADSDDLLTQVAETSMTGKGTGDIAPEVLAETVVEAVRTIRADDGVDRDRLRVYTQTGEGASATELVDGAVINGREPAHDSMERTIEDAAVAVLDFELEVRQSRGDAEAAYDVTSVDQLNAAIEAEQTQLREVADLVAETGADVVIVSDDGRMADPVAARLADHGILAFDRVQEKYAAAAARATGAKRVGSFEALTDVEERDLGHAERVRAETYANGVDLAFVECGDETDVVTVFARGGTEHTAEELERAIEDALNTVTAAIETGVVPGAGATEMAIAQHVRGAATGIEGRKQIAAKAFADAIEVIPRTLAENAGMNPVDTLIDLRAASPSENPVGIVVEGPSGTVDDPVEHGVLDAATAKHKTIASATEVAASIARIDGVIAADGGETD